MKRLVKRLLHQAGYELKPIVAVWRQLFFPISDN